MEQFLQGTFEAVGTIEAKEVFLVILGSSFTIFLFLYKELQEFFRKYKLVTPLLGTWYTYHFSRSNFESVFREEKWEIKRSLKGLVINTSDKDRPTLLYHGNVSFDSAHVIINLTGIKHIEITQYRLTQCIPSDDSIMLGFHLSKDFDHELFSCMKLVCREKRQSQSEAIKVLKKSVVWLPDETSIRLSKKSLKISNRLIKKLF